MSSQAVVHLKEHKAHQARDVDLAVLGAEELLQVVVGQGRILGVDLAHDADLDLADREELHGLKVRDDPAELGLDRLGLEALALEELAADLLDPAVDVRVGLPGIFFVRAGLVGQEHQQVAVGQRGQRPAQERQRDLEAAVLLQAREVDRDHRHLAHARVLERLA